MIISLGLLLLWGFTLSLTLWGTWRTLRQTGLRTPGIGLPVDALRPVPISVLKPLKGVECDMAQNLESFFKIAYPQFELLFSVADPRDPVVIEVERLRALYPEVDSQLITGDIEVGPNPKVNNLIRSDQIAKYDWRVISDSNTRVAPDYLYQLLPCLNHDVGVVSAVVAGTGASTWPGRFEAAYLNTFFARWTHLAAFFGKPFVIGKSMCFRRATADRFGGLRNLGQFIAEDNMFGQAVLRLGLKIQIMRAPVNQHIGNYDFRTFWNRHVRWGRIRKSQAPIAFFAEPLTMCAVAGALGTLGIYGVFTNGLLIFAIGHTLVWGFCDLLMMRRMESTMSFKSVAAWLVRECLAVPQWVHMAVGSSIVWRGMRLKILPGGRVVHPEFSSKLGWSDHVIPVGRRNQQPSSRRRQPLERLVGMGVARFY